MVPSTSFLFFLKLIVLSYASEELRITKQPQNDSVNSGQTHLLNCHFNQLVNCAWTRESIITLIKQRYRYTSNNGTNTQQCDIEISNFTDIDAATWQCKNMIVQSQNNTRITMSEKAFLSINYPEKERIDILLNQTPVSMLDVSNHKQWKSLNCVAESTEQIKNLQWTLDGQVLKTGTFSSTCSSDANWCCANLTWTDGWESLASSETLTCSAEGRNLRAKVALYYPSNTTKIGFYSLLAAASFVLIVVIVASAVACCRYPCNCPCCSDPDPGLFQSIDELQYPCDSVLRIPQKAMSKHSLNAREALCKGDYCKRMHKVPWRYLQMPDQCSRCSDPEASSKEPSYLELTSCQPFHVCNCPCHLDVINLDYCTGNCSSHTCGNQQLAYVTMSAPAVGSSAARDLELEELYSDGQSVENANGLGPNLGSHVNNNAPDNPDILVVDRHPSQESLYNDCIPTGSRPTQTRQY